jgi:site-specific recombinase XerD
MADVDVNRADPMEAWAEPLEAWLRDSTISKERSRRAVLALGRFSAWVTGRGLGAKDVGEDVIDEYVDLERQRSGSRVPAAAQYLPLVKRFLAARGVLVLRPPVSRARHGRPRLRGGPLDEVVLELVGWLRDQGYAAGTASSVACTAARLSYWMARHALSAQDLDDAVLARFVASQSQGRRRHPSSAHRIVTVRKFFLATGALCAPLPPSAPSSPVDLLLQEWIGHLCTRRGVSQGWAREARRWAEGFVAELPVDPDGQVLWDGVDAAVVNRYVTWQGMRYSLSSRRHLVSAMRGLLDWAFLTGRLDRPMSAGVLRPAPSAPGLPHGLTAAQVEALISAADTSTSAGLRDRAIVVLISRLALRAGEVAALTLDDLHWHAGALVVHGKGGRVLTLPIPTDVGQALVDYLQDARPAGVADRAVFIRLRPPLVGLSSKGISGVIAHLATEAGLGTVHAHALRHTTATAVRAAGGSLSEARELLGHARTDTTMVYARTDLVALRELVPAWGKVPGP